MASASTRLSSNPSKKVRVVARIRGFKEHESIKEVSEPWISVREPSGDRSSSNRVAIAFGGQSTKDVYEIDACYKQTDDNFAIFSGEIKPLLPSLFDGQNVTIITFGARGSGKTYTVQGDEKEQGLASLTVAEILSGTNEKEMPVSISLFEVFQEHVYDLLDPKHPEVQVFEDAQGKIKLKGLSKAVLKSLSEFHKCYPLGCGLNRRSHKGLILEVSSNNGVLKSKIVAKMNFVDLAGFEDARRKSIEGTGLIENSRINKSLYALLNVVYASNANEPRVPFRESKLTRILKDSFRGKDHVSLLTCLNPTVCQDTIYTLSLASRSCQAFSRMSSNSTQKSRYLAKPTISSVKGKLNVGLGSSTKKQASSTPYISAKNKSRIIAKEKMVFDEGREATTLKQTNPSSASDLQSRFLTDMNSEIAPSLQEEEESMSKDFVVTTEKDEETYIPNAFEVIESQEEKVTEYPRTENDSVDVTPIVDGNTKALTLFGEVDNKEKENKSHCLNGDVSSPPLSSRLQELSNNLKNLYNSTPVQIKLPIEADSSRGGKVAFTNVMDPKTPVQDKLDVARFNSPWEKFTTRSTGLKQSLADEYLRFINSASKAELKGLKGIGEKRATYIVQLREESPEPFKNLEDLKDIGLSEKQIKGMMKKVAGDLFS